MVVQSFSKDQCEEVVLFLLLEGYLMEEYSYTSYTSYSYVVVGKKVYWLAVRLVAAQCRCCGRGRS